MAEEKRKTKTSSAVKQRYNQKTYSAVTAYLPKDLAAAFKEKCATEGIPQAQVIRKAVEEFLQK
jgi:predicted DNA binding CopG/RHH family protein